jgi:hypothetical protein
MTGPTFAVAKVAKTPVQAKVFVAILKAEGIDASVEGESLADEVAISRRLMNLAGVRVLVPADSLARAREVLEPIEIDEQELERQALAAAPEHAPGEAPMEPDPVGVGVGVWLAALAIVGGAAVYALC